MSPRGDPANILTQDYDIHDPPLSDLGLEQCVALRDSLWERFSSVLKEDVAIIASPMRRTLQTAQLALGWLQDRGIRIEADPDWQENSAKPCDTGTPLESLSRDFPVVDYGFVDDIWPDKTSQAAQKYAYRKASILERGNRCLERLCSRPEKLIFVVSHSGFLRLGVVGWWFFNSDYRIFHFDEFRQGSLAEKLSQDETTSAGGLGLSWTHRVELGSDIPDEDSKIPTATKEVATTIWLRYLSIKYGIQEVVQNSEYGSP
ncbi:Phosphoglycerate mutase [Paramyrothecium foliicola]|nr:Phosphoglycerate mutase [Paramyrothecium foliicola]